MTLAVSKCSRRFRPLRCPALSTTARAVAPARPSRNARAAAIGSRRGVGRAGDAAAFAGELERSGGWRQARSERQRCQEGQGDPSSWAQVQIPLLSLKLCAGQEPWVEAGPMAASQEGFRQTR